MQRRVRALASISRVDLTTTRIVAERVRAPRAIAQSSQQTRSPGTHADVAAAGGGGGGGGGASGASGRSPGV